MGGGARAKEVKGNQEREAFAGLGVLGEGCFGKGGACLHHFCLPEGKAQHIREHEQEKDEGKEYKSIGSLCGEKIRVEDVQEGAYEKPGVDA